ncbi:Susd and RagB outer membrane lipoprotein [Pedobacter caeni]|uniref:Susd and RagB outer membrane lipoprotein n=2 Tax=Pedobacter caeni TaxID=288992 RepID=A0A1M4YSJ6_9SPHI|nr:Susd and RagB outer membrane lipoprotein [Pedobacter caeni]
MILATAMLWSSCKKFEEINVDPVSANEDQVQPEYFINGSITAAQQDPDVAERAFVLYWKTAGHQQSNGGISSGAYNDGWSSIYYNQISAWITSANTAIEIANKQIAEGKAKPHTNNLIQIARIWRGYLMSEMSDNFGPIPMIASQGTNPEFVEVKMIYYYILSELKDAGSKLDVALKNKEEFADLDPSYRYNYKNWKTYANSMRMRLAMRLSEVDENKAKAEFEDAATGSDFITNMDQAFKVQEKPGWNALAGVMSREWNPQFISATLNNLYLGLGGVKSADQLDASYQPYIKSEGWLGLKYDDHFTSKTNNPSAGYWFDGLPYSIDPRAYKTFIIPGDFENANFNAYPSWTNDAKTTKRNLLNSSNETLKTIEAKYTWNASNTGNWDVKGARNLVRAYEGTIPRLSNQFRTSASTRIFFAPWETYFLLAEAAERGWNTPMSGKAAYEAGIRSNFEYWGVTGNLGAYLSSSDFNRVGTSVNWDHTAEPAASHTMSFKNGYTDVAGTTAVLYPKNDLYKNGTVKNDHLTKIITQKFIAQTPWLPLEGWNDQRRLGLPFFENPAIEKSLPDLPALTDANYMTSNVSFFPQRLRYPSNLRITNSKGYEQAVTALKGADAVLTPLWWAKK